MIIHSYESTARSDACVEYIRSLKKIQMMEQVFLLPIPSTRDYQTISGTNIYIYSILELLSPSCVLIGYSLPEWFLSAASDTGCIVHDVSLDDPSVRYHHHSEPDEHQPAAAAFPEERENHRKSKTKTNQAK